MTRCAVCEAEIHSSLEEFGDPREPVCARCWLEGYEVPFDGKMATQNRKEREEKAQSFLVDRD